MTYEELQARINETYEKQKAETEEYRKNCGFIGLDSPISAKYAKIRKQIFEQYEKEKQAH